MDPTVIKEQPSCFILGVVFKIKNLSAFVQERIGNRCVMHDSKC